MSTPVVLIIAAIVLLPRRSDHSVVADSRMTMTRVRRAINKHSDTFPLTGLEIAMTHTRVTL